MFLIHPLVGHSTDQTITASPVLPLNSIASRYMLHRSLSFCHALIHHSVEGSFTSPCIRCCQHQRLSRQHGECLRLGGSGGVGGGENCPGATEGRADDDVAHLRAAAGGARHHAVMLAWDGMTWCTATWNSVATPGISSRGGAQHVRSVNAS